MILSKSLIITTIVVTLITFLAYVIATYKFTVYYDTIVENIAVKYQKSFTGGQEVKILFKNSIANRVVVSLYAWMPDGNMNELGVYIGSKKVIVDTEELNSILAQWRQHFLSKNTNPALVKPGIIILATFHEKDKVSTIIKIVPLDIERIFSRKESVTIEINVDPRDMIIVADKTRIAMLSSQAQRKTVLSNTTFVPLREIEDNCDGLCNSSRYCFLWKLSEPYYYKLNIGIPLVVARVCGLSDYVHTVLLREYYAAKRSQGVEVVFGVLASIKADNGEITYKIPGYIMSLTGEDKVWIDYYKRFWENYDFNNSAILAVGFYGDIAFAHFKLYYCHSSIRQCIQLPDEVNMTLLRPVIENNQMIPWYGIDDNPDDGQGNLESAIKVLLENWNLSRDYIDYGGLYIDIFDIMLDMELPTLSTVSVLPLLGIKQKALPLTALLSPSVGITRQDTTKIMLACNINLDVKDYKVRANYVYSPVKFQYENKVWSFYINALVYPK